MGIRRIQGRGCVLRGDDIDTDRVIPARYLRCVTFEGLGEHAFQDDREQAKGDHPFDAEHFEGAEILIVEHNFGCGSSREHAPQALMRRGFRALIGASFAEIFAGNCTALGLPCATLPEDHLGLVMEAVEADPGHTLVLDVEQRVLTCRAGTFEVEIDAGTHQQLVQGTWNATSVLLEAGDRIEATASRLPYMNDFAS